MLVFGNPRGSYREMTIDSSRGRGVQLELPADNGAFQGVRSLVTSFSAVQSEILGIQNCLNKSVFAYAFGHNPQQSQYTVGVTLFMQQCGGGITGLADHLSAYARSRVSESKDKGEAKFTIGGACLRGHLVGQHIEGSNSELNLANISYIFTMLRPYS